MTILLTGGRGKTTSHIAALLDAANVSFVVASRSSNPDSKYRQLSFDWLDHTTYDNVLLPKHGMQPISAVWLVPPPDLAPQVNAFIDHACAKAVQRFVLLSASMLERGDFAMGQIHEHLASLEGINYTVLRPTWFMGHLGSTSENFSSRHEFQCEAIRKEDSIYSAAENGKIPFISVVDIARVAIRALMGDLPGKTDPILLGPQLLTYDDVAEALTKLLDRTIRHVRLTEGELAEKIHEYGMPLEDARIQASMDLVVRAGREETLNETVLELTGKMPRTFLDFASCAHKVWLPKK